jgi:putative hemolysin
MCNKMKNGLILLLIVSIMFLSGCIGNENSEESVENVNQIANPAAVYCEEQGHILDIRADEDGNQSGICVSSEGNECDEWLYYRGECEL